MAMPFLVAPMPFVVIALNLGEGAFAMSAIRFNLAQIHSVRKYTGLVLFIVAQNKQTPSSGCSYVIAGGS